MDTLSERAMAEADYSLLKEVIATESRAYIKVVTLRCGNPHSSVLSKIECLFTQNDHDTVTM